MANYFLTNKAVEDLAQIWNYTVKAWSESQADKYYNEIIDACQKVSENIFLGKRYFKLLPNLFGYKTNKHIIFFRRITPEFVEITRILHEQMDFDNQLFN